MCPKDNSTNTIIDSLHEAAYQGDYDTLKRLLGQGLDVDAQDAYGYTPLYKAVYTYQYDSSDCIDFLLSHGADILRCRPNEESVFRRLLYEALIIDDFTDEAQYVISRCTKIDRLDDRGYNALHYAIRFGGHFSTAEIVRILLDAGADPLCPTKEGYSPLQLAVTVGDEPVIEMLRHYDSREAQSLPSLHGAELMQAAKLGDLPRIRELLAAGADPDGDDWNLELMEHPDESPLFELARSDADDATSAEGIKLLLAAGANVFREEHSYASPLLSAAYAKKPQTMGVLIEAGIDPNHRNIRGRNARSAIFSNSGKTNETTQCLMLLLDHGVSIMRGIGQQERENDDGIVPGCGLLEEEYEETLKALIARGYPLDEADDDGYTLLHYCADFEDEGRCAGLLLAAGADINARNKAGQTPLALADSNGNDELAIFLMEHGGKM